MQHFNSLEVFYEWFFRCNTWRLTRSCLFSYNSLTKKANFWTTTGFVSCFSIYIPPPRWCWLSIAITSFRFYIYGYETSFTLKIPFSFLLGSLPWLTDQRMTCFMARNDFTYTHDLNNYTPGVGSLIWTSQSKRKYSVLPVIGKWELVATMLQVSRQMQVGSTDSARIWLQASSE